MFYPRRRVLLWVFCVLVSQNVQCGDEPGKTNPVIIELPTAREEANVEQKTEGNHVISIFGDKFMLDGEPLHIISGSLHYFRLPAAYWRDRLRKLKAAGLNSVATYVEWSYHEPEERQYTFEGDRDVAQFVRIAAEEGLHVLLRPGPYICAERDLGGFPYWLLGKYPKIKLRTTDKDYMEETRIWMAKLFEQLEPLLFGNGGPIILVQVENEYGSYGNDMAYKEQLRDIIKGHVGVNALLYTTDGTYPSMLAGGAVAGALTTIDFGVGQDVNNTFDMLRRRFVPSGPLMNSEFYPGWLTHWGESFQRISTDSVVKTLRDMLDIKINVNFYMFFGGSNFEFSAGANHGDSYQPDITSYDYDAPLTEAGDPTPKYEAIRETIKQYNSELQYIPPPVPSPKGAYGDITVSPTIALLSPVGVAKLGKKYDDVTNRMLPTFEQLRQRGGLMLYETTLNDTDGVLQIAKPRDWIYVYVDNEFQGAINRMYKVIQLPIKAKPGSKLSLLVENQGRINYGPLLHDYKGILSPVTHNNMVLNGPWSVLGYPLENMDITSSLELAPSTHGPVLYDGYFMIPAGESPMDTFLDTSGWDKGYVWINGHNLGRYWPTLGPQVTLYVPGVWLNRAPKLNHLQILELGQASDASHMKSIDHPILDRTASGIQL